MGREVGGGFKREDVSRERKQSEVKVAQSCPTLCNLMDGIIVEVTQSCLTLCDPMDCIIHGILQARILEWVACPFSRRSSQPREQTQVSRSAGGFFTS